VESEGVSRVKESNNRGAMQNVISFGGSVGRI